jgi:hypothetical protein
VKGWAYNRMQEVKDTTGSEKVRRILRIGRNVGAHNDNFARRV